MVQFQEISLLPLWKATGNFEARGSLSKLFKGKYEVGISKRVGSVQTKKTFRGGVGIFSGRMRSWF